MRHTYVYFFYPIISSAAFVDVAQIKLEYICFLSQCNAREIRTVFFRGKRGAIVRRHPAFCSLCAMCRVFIPAAVRPTLLRQMDMGSLTCAYRWVRTVRGSGTNKSAHELTQRDRNNYFSPCPATGSNPGSSDLNSDSLTIDLPPATNDTLTYTYWYQVRTRGHF